jgi:hypothetical protein
VGTLQSASEGAAASPVRSRGPSRTVFAVENNLISSSSTSTPPTSATLQNTSSPSHRKLSWRSRRGRVTSMESQKLTVVKLDAEAIRRSDHSNMVLLVVLCRPPLFILLLIISIVNYSLYSVLFLTLG